MDPQPIDNEQQGIDINNPNVAQPQADIRRDRDAFNARYRDFVPIRNGAYGEVYKARDTEQGTDVALKMFRTRNAYHLHSFIRELRVLTIIEFEARVNNHTVSLLNFHHNEDHLSRSYLVLDLMDRTLGEEVRRRRALERSLSLDEIRALGAQIASGLAFLANLDIVHADLKPGNLMFKDENSNQLRIIDFGLSFESGTVIDHNIKTGTFCAMEVFLGLGPYTNSIDIWSFGCILAYMYTGRDLFASTDDRAKKIVHQIVRTLGMPPDDMLRIPGCLRYFKQTWNGQWIKDIGLCDSIFEPRSRNIRQFLDLNRLQLQPDESQEHRWFVELIEEMLVYNVNTRINLARIINHSFFTGQPAPPQ